MAKSNKKLNQRKKGAVVVPKKRRSAPVRPSQALVDASAREYADLIRDPCNAKLTHTIWPGSAGAIVSRFEVDYVAFNNATSTSGVFVFVPGTNQVYSNSVDLATDVTGTTLSSGFLGRPGSTFLDATAGTIRCVAACAQVSFPGTELNRSGIVSLGILPFGTLISSLSTAAGGGNTNTTTAQLRTLCQHTERMPQEMAEITWYPGSGDVLPFANAGLGGAAANVVEDSQNKNCLVVTASGFPVSTGVRVRVVYVCEWTPRLNQGLVATAEVPASRSSLTDVLIDLHNKGGSNWFINAFKRARPYVQAAGSIIRYAGKTLGPAMMAL